MIRSVKRSETTLIGLPITGKHRKIIRNWGKGMRIHGLIRDGKKRQDESPEILDSNADRALGSQILCGA